MAFAIAATAQPRRQATDQSRNDWPGSVVPRAAGAGITTVPSAA